VPGATATTQCTHSALPIRPPNVHWAARDFKGSRRTPKGSLLPGGAQWEEERTLQVNCGMDTLCSVQEGEQPPRDQTEKLHRDQEREVGSEGKGEGGGEGNGAWEP
jgi:hypothetical protein